jgi:hypothetical protein
VSAKGGVHVDQDDGCRACRCDELALTETDRVGRDMFLHTGQDSARARPRARVLLKLGDGWSWVKICRSFAVCCNTYLNTCTHARSTGWARCHALCGTPAIGAP